MQLLRHEHGFDEPLGLLSDCHRRIERFLTILQKVALDAPPESLPKMYREGLQTALDYFDKAAPLHTLDEEESLFPRITSNPEAAEVIAHLERDHKDSEQYHQIVEQLGRSWLQKEKISPEARLKFTAAIDYLLKLYGEHIVTEDTLLFPLAARLLDDQTLQEVGKEMAGRRGLESK